ncbi:MAG TPA: hypothetical protein HA349_07095 [Methanotrichaceae archaeon]|nr:hypothetical protein [Methanotrichaceae archaeon]
MNPSIRRILGPSLAMLLLMSFVGTSLAFPSESRRGAEDLSLAKVPGIVFCQIADMGHIGDGPQVLISIVRSERGFVLGPDNETLPVRLQVEKVRGIDPSQVRRLLRENRTLREIKAEIEGDNQAYNYRGSMRIGRAQYVLDNLNMTSEDPNSTLEADVMEPVWGAIQTASEPSLEMAGHISIGTRRQDGSGIRVGSLVIFNGPYAGSYAILLDSSIGTGCGMESCPMWGGDLASFTARSEVREIRQQGNRHSFSAWSGAGSPVSFWDMISRSPGAVMISTTFGPGCGGGGCPFQPDPSAGPSEMMPWNLACGELGLEGFCGFGGDGECDPAGFAPGDGPHRLWPMASEI